MPVKETSPKRNVERDGPGSPPSSNGSPKKASRYQVPAVQRVFAILETLSVTEGGLPIKEIAKIHGVPYSTVFYLLETLVDSGYLQRTEDQKRYMLGHKLFRLAQRAAAFPVPELRNVAGPVLEELVELTRLTGHIAILEGDEVIYVDRREPRSLIRLNTWIGRRNAAYRTSVGKALLMKLPDEEVRRLYPPEKLVKKTERTITDIDKLLADLAASRARGYSIDDGEDGKESRCVAAPIFDQTGAAIASMGIVGVFGQIEPDQFEPLGKLVRRFALDISKRLGFVQR